MFRFVEELMKRTSLCSAINLALVCVIWAIIVVLPNLIVGQVLVWWINMLLVAVGLVAAGYVVQYALSPFVNRAVMGKAHREKLKSPDQETLR